MTGPTTAVLAALIALGLVAAVVFALRGQRALPDAAGRSVEVPLEPPDAAMAPADSLVAEPRREREAVGGAEVAAESTGLTSGPAGAVLRVRVVAAESSEALAGVRVTVHAEKGGGPSLSVESTRGTLTESPRTEGEGEVQFEVPAGEGLALSARGESGEAGQASLVLAPFAPGELRELVLELPTEPDLAFHGRVLDDASGAPIAGAELALREGPREPAAAGESAADGHFELRLGSWRQALLAVSAPGYAPREVPVTLGHEAPTLAREVRLARHASLAVRLRDGAGAPVVGALVVLEPEEDAFTLEGGTIFFDRDSGGTSAASDESGECRFEALAPDVRLRVEVRRAGHPSVRDLPSITLRAGEERAVEWRLDTGALLTGLVVDPSGMPVPDEELWLLHANREGPELFDANQRSDARREQSDAHGRFEFTAVPSGAWWLGPAATRRYSDPPDPEALAPFAERVELASEERVREVRVVVQRGLFVRGRVLDADEAPAADVFVFGALVGSPRTSLTVETSEDGLFVLGPLVPGRYSLVAQKLGEGESLPIEVEAGGDVLLRLLRGATLSGSVLEGATGQGVEAWVRATRGTTGIWSMVNSQEDGSFSLGGLTPGTYDLCARAGGGLVGSLRVALGAGEERTVTLRLARGATLRLRAAVSEEKRTYRVLQDGLELEAVELEPGAVAEVVVPAGTIVVSGADASADAHEIVLEAGEFHELELGGGA